MAQNSRPRSVSSDSSKKKYKPERAHARASRQVHISTPRVLNSTEEEPEVRSSRGSSRRRSSGRRGTNSSRQTTRGRRRAPSNNTRSKPKQKRGIGIKLIISLLVVSVVLAGGFAALYFSNLFPITSIQVSGNVKLENGYVVSLADVPEDSTFFRIDDKGITERLMSEPWVKEVSVNRTFPDTIVLAITEQPVAAVVDIVPETANDSTQQWIITEDGMWISQINVESQAGVRINPEEFVTLPQIRDASAAVRPEPGMVETDGGVVNALSLLNQFSTEMREMVSTISAPDAVKTTLTLSNNVGVAFGEAKDVEAKEKAIATMLAEHEGTITYINVRVADRPSFRATE